MRRRPEAWFAHLSLARKLTAISMVSTAAALGFVCLVVAVFDFVSSRQRLVADLAMLADVAGRNSTAAVSFGDQNAAADILDGLRRNGHIVTAAIIPRGGREPLARVDRDRDRPEAWPAFPAEAIRTGQAWHQFTAARVVVARPIVMGSEVLGSVVIVSDLRALATRAAALAQIGLLALGGALWLGLAVGSRLQRMIAVPLGRLTETTAIVSREHRYDVRVERWTGDPADEINVLVEGFNRMLGELQARDAALLAHQDTLEAAVAERTAELRALNDEMAAARDRAREASRAKSEFLANMSHEIRTPLNGILGMTELALGTEANPETREYLTTVMTSAESLLGILNDILDFSKIESGKLELEAVSFSPRDLLARAVKVMGYRAEQKGLELLADVDPAVPSEVIGDPGRVAQVLTNLIGNAIKFTPSGHVLVEMREDSRAGGCTLLHILVTDTGIGVPEDKHEHIFEAFSQADGSTTRRFGGTGLGLTISASLVRMMGGKIWLESKEGHGSIFHVTLPLEVAGMASEPQAPSSLAGRSALIVDDNEVNRRILTEQLSRQGMKPAAVEDGYRAMRTLRAAAAGGHPFDVVVLDARMPEPDGLTVAGWIRADPELAKTPLMMLSSSGQWGESARARALDMAAYITKPADPSRLAAELRRVFQGPDAAQAVAAVPAGQPIRPLHVLLAEDNLVNQRVATGLLERRGHRVTLAANGREAVEAAGREPFDLILMDVQMPEMGGLEATQVIREEEAGTARHIRIVAMTAHAMTGDRERCLAAGMDGYLSKPINQADLFRIVEEGPATSPAQPALTPAHTPPGPPAAPASDRTLDVGELLARVGGDPELMRTVARLFLEDCPARLSDIRQAVLAGDAERLRTSAHALRGAAGTLSARGLMGAAEALERLGADAQMDAAEAALEQLTVEAALLAATLQALDGRGACAP